VNKVLLLGLGPTALTALESLAQRFEVIGFVRAVGDGEDDRTLARRAAELSVPVLADVDPASVESVVDAARPDCTVVSSYNRILRPSLLRRCPFVNVHYAPLPAYRGRANVNWAIINGEAEAAISIHVIEPGLDDGNILFQEAVPLGPDDTVSDVYQRLNEVQRRELGRTVERYLEGFAGRPQDGAESSYGCTRVEEDGEISWSASTTAVYALVRALAPPYPRAFTYLGTRRLAIVRAAPSPSGRRFVGRVPGRVVERSTSTGHVDVLTGDGALRIHEVRVGDGGEVVPAATVITSTRLTLGLRSSDLLARIEELERRLGEVGRPDLPGS